MILEEKALIKLLARVNSMKPNMDHKVHNYFLNKILSTLEIVLKTIQLLSEVHTVPIEWRKNLRSSNFTKKEEPMLS